MQNQYSQKQTFSPIHDCQISRYRDALMGAVILWILIFRTNLFSFGETLAGRICGFIKDTGYCGVDIFFFLSGFGLMYDWTKKRYTVSAFYIKRGLRVVPIYWIIVTLQYLFQWYNNAAMPPLADAAAMLILWPFLAQKNLSMWFIPAILFAYLIFPLVANIMVRTERRIRLLIVLTGLCLCLWFVIIMTHHGNHLLIVLLRLPSFFIGMYIGYLASTQTTRHPGLHSYTPIYIHIVLLLTAAATLFFLFRSFSYTTLWHYGLWWFPGIILSYPCSMLLSIMINKFQALAFVKIIPAILSMIGPYSLELYLTQALLSDALSRLIDAAVSVCGIPLLHPAVFDLTLLTLTVFAGIALGTSYKNRILKNAVGKIQFH